MNMKEHILSALNEQFEHWEELLANLSKDQITALLLPSTWCIKNVVAHLWAWQQISVSRMEAAQQDREPIFPEWIAGLPIDWENNADQTNTWVYETYQDQPWVMIHQNWREGFSRFLKLSEAIPERNLLDSGRYSWLEGYPLAFILLASYDHHQEHLDKLIAWLSQNGK